MRSDDAFLVEVLRALRLAHLEALIIGNAGAVLHGAPVTTMDLDLLVRDTPRNRQKLRHFCEFMGAPLPRRFSELSPVESILSTAVPIDFLFDQIPPGVRFESLRARRTLIPVGEETAAVASLEDIIASKAATGRAKDVAVLPILTETLAVLRRLRAADA
jgi:hypothetical protein